MFHQACTYVHCVAQLSYLFIFYKHIIELLRDG